jgi:hypothetical protein
LLAAVPNTPRRTRFVTDASDPDALSDAILMPKLLLCLFARECSPRVHGYLIVSTFVFQDDIVLRQKEISEASTFAQKEMSKSTPIF